jgi:hypothetical protein
MEAKPEDDHAFVTTDFSLIAAEESGCVLNSGASTHFDPKWENFTNFHTIPPRPINAADG